jgi:hypothetical protein
MKGETYCGRMKGKKRNDRAANRKGAMLQTLSIFSAATMDTCRKI